MTQTNTDIKTIEKTKAESPFEWIKDFIEVFELNEDEQLYFAECILKLLGEKKERKDKT